MAGGYDTDDTAGLPDPATLPGGEAADAAWIEVIRKMDEVYADLVRYQVELEHKHAELEEAHGFISDVLGRAPVSRAGKALLTKKGKVFAGGGQ